MLRLILLSSALLGLVCNHLVQAQFLLGSCNPNRLFIDLHQNHQAIVSQLPYVDKFVSKQGPPLSDMVFEDDAKVLHVGTFVKIEQVAELFRQELEPVLMKLELVQFVQACGPILSYMKPCADLLGDKRQLKPSESPVSEANLRALRLVRLCEFTVPKMHQLEEALGVGAGGLKGSMSRLRALVG